MVLVGVTTDQGEVGKPLTGGKETGEAMTESTMRGREMRTTETVLNVLSERGKNHKPVERLHRQLYNIGLHEMAYGQIYVNRGATTRGVNDNTLDGTSRKRIREKHRESQNGNLQMEPDTPHIHTEKRR